MNILKAALNWLLFLMLLVFVGFSGFYFSVYDSFQDFRSDLGLASQRIRVTMFRHGAVESLSSDDIRYVYQKSCYRKCHGEAAMITAVLSPAGWFQVVERMRVKEGVDISGREAEMIIKYLEETYPTTVSKYSFEERKRVHEAVWRNDMGSADIYTDIIWATPEYLDSIGAAQLIDEYELSKYIVFIVSFSAHEGEVPLFDLDNQTFIRTEKVLSPPATPWRMRFQTSDKHHFEAIVRFDKRAGGSGDIDGSRWIEILLKDIGTPERIFRWDLPLVYPPIFNSVEAKDR